MRIRRSRRTPREITGAFCTPCQKICGVERIETEATTTMFTLMCGHGVTLTPGALCGLDVQAHAIILYPDRNNLPTRSELA